MNYILPLFLMFAVTVMADHPIPPDSTARWDFRGQPRSITNAAFEKLYRCQTYEELRDALIVAIRDLEKGADDPTPIYVASDCRLALIRTYYLLGDLQTADRLLSRYSVAYRKADGSPDLGDDALKPLPGEEEFEEP